jgi:Predicted membrane protein (DUF2157)
MLSFEPELTDARDDGLLTPPTAARLIAMQRREIFSLFGEIRMLAWIGAMLVAGGVSVLISNHIKDIGALTIAIVLAAAAVCCYAWAWIRRERTSLVDDSILLLGGMLVSADAGWIATQWHIDGPRTLLFLAIFHAVCAYRFESRGLLSLSIGALAGWLGIKREVDILFSFSSKIDLAISAFVCAAILAAWREIDRRARTTTTFTPVFEHTGITLAFWGALILAADEVTATAGVLITLTLGALATVHAFRTNTEAYLLYAVIYGTLAVDMWVWRAFPGPTLSPFVTLVTAIAAVIGLTMAHRRFRSRAA